MKLLDVAKLAEVSQTTVSFVMTGRRGTRISRDPDLRGHQTTSPTSRAQAGLPAQAARPQPSRDHVPDDRAGVRQDRQRVLRRRDDQRQYRSLPPHDHLLFIGETQGDPEVEKQVLCAMVDRGVGGFLYASMDTQTVIVDKSLLSKPLVLLNALDASRSLPTVVPDEVGAGRTAAQALLDRGHRAGIVLVGEQPQTVVAAQEGWPASRKR